MSEYVLILDTKNYPTASKRVQTVLSELKCSWRNADFPAYTKKRYLYVHSDKSISYGESVLISKRIQDRGAEYIDVSWARNRKKKCRILS